MAKTNLKLKSATPQDQGDLVRLTGGEEIRWPKGAEIPRTMKEALADGWEVDGSECGGSEYLEIGLKVLRKFVGEVELHISVPYRARHAHGKPRKGVACHAKLVKRSELFVHERMARGIEAGVKAAAEMKAVRG